MWLGGYDLTDNRLAPPGVDATVSKTLDPPLFLPAAKVVCEGYVFTGSLSVHRGWGLCPGRGLCPGGVSVQERSLSEGVSVQGKGLCPGEGSLSRGSLSGGSLSRRVGGVCRAARILLECILVSLLVKDRLTNSLSMDWFQM